jgi:hypothetical protein
MLETCRIEIAILLGLFGLASIVTNIACWITAGKRGKSFIPLIGGTSLGIALVVYPSPGLAYFAWLPLVIDPGCFLFPLALIHLLRNRKR